MSCICTLQRNGSLLDTTDAVLQFAQTMTWKGLHPVEEWVKKIYPKGVKLTRQGMTAFEKRLKRLPGLGKWFVKIGMVHFGPISTLTN
jgi:hypothetical protein